VVNINTTQHYLLHFSFTSPLLFATVSNVRADNDLMMGRNNTHLKYVFVVPTYFISISNPFKKLSLKAPPNTFLMARFSHHVDVDDESDENICEESSSSAVVPWAYRMINHSQSYVIVRSSLPSNSLQEERSQTYTCGIRKRKSFQWLLIIKYCIFAFLLKFTCQRYLPPPPDPYTSWNEYTHEIKATFVNTAKLLAYVSMGLVKNLIQDVSYHGQDGMKRIIDKVIHMQIPYSPRIHGLVTIWSVLRKQTSTRTCTFQLPHQRIHAGPIIPSSSSTAVAAETTHLITTEDYLRNQIIGQDKAIQAVARTLDAWIQQPPVIHPLHHATTTATSTTTAPTTSKPLFLFFVGTQGVGKSQTIQSIAEMLLSHCSYSTAYTHEQQGFQYNVPKDRIFIIHGMDYSSTTSSSTLTSSPSSSLFPKDDHDMNQTHSCTHDSMTINTTTSQECSIRNMDLESLNLFEKILQHTYNSSNMGNIIVLDHIHVMSPWVLKKVIQRIQTFHNHPPFDSLLDSHNRIISFQKTIFILTTTDWGIDSIFTLLRKYKTTSNIPYRELQHAMKEDIRSYMGDLVCIFIFTNISQYHTLFLLYYSFFSPLDDFQYYSFLSSNIKRYSTYF